MMFFTIYSFLHKHDVLHMRYPSHDILQTLALVHLKFLFLRAHKLLTKVFKLFLFIPKYVSNASKCIYFKFLVFLKIYLIN